ncbi:MAG TPA: peptidoglycan DD-metalloendopeptidase family protein [Acidimicrobiia bacterium]|nr:peptidoglycan DD-metalloendopeptidase family protein [Acidimicrobiia bacterium]
MSWFTGARRVAAFCLLTSFVAGLLGGPSLGAAPGTPGSTTIPAPGLPKGAPGPLPISLAPDGFPAPIATPLDPPAAPLTWLTPAQTTGAPVRSEHGALQQLGSAKHTLKAAQRAVKARKKSLARLHAQVRNEQRAIADLQRVRDTLMGDMRERAITVYMGGSDSMVGDLLETNDVSSFGRRNIYADAAQRVDNDDVDRATRHIKEANDTLDALERDVNDANVALAAAKVGVGRAFTEFVMLSALVSDPKHGGRVFPVDGAYEFDDSWASFRTFADNDAHEHHATDIMAPLDTPVVAVESGVLRKVGWNRLGGWRLWIEGASGTKYYYAHLSAYAPFITDGTPVLAGQYLGRVGNTGDAQGGPTHLHFEVHLADDAGVNGFPLLCLLAGAPVPPIPPPEVLPSPDATTTTTTTTTTSTTTLPKTTTTARKRS